MKSKNIDKSVDDAGKQTHDTPEIDHALSGGKNTQERDEHELVISSLTLMLERLVSYFQQRAAIDDRETLIFCLKHLFSHVDVLYCVTLPALASTTHTRISGSSSTHKSRIGFRYALWTNLQEMQQHVERIESLCHLLNRTVPRLLCALDTPDARSNKQPTTPARNLHSSPRKQDDTEQWQRAYEVLTARLSRWQEQNGERLSFASSTLPPAYDASSTTSPGTSADAASSLSTSAIQTLLTKIDASLMLVLDSAGATFGDIVPDFQVVAHGDDEVVATLLFDLMQQADLLLIQCDTLFGPMQDLTRHYMLFE